MGEIEYIKLQQIHHDTVMLEAAILQIDQHMFMNDIVLSHAMEKARKLTTKLVKIQLNEDRVIRHEQLVQSGIYTDASIHKSTTLERLSKKFNKPVAEQTNMFVAIMDSIMEYSHAQVARTNQISLYQRVVDPLRGKGYRFPI